MDFNEVHMETAEAIDWVCGTELICGWDNLKYVFSVGFKNRFVHGFRGLSICLSDMPVRCVFRWAAFTVNIVERNKHQWISISRSLSVSVRVSHIICIHSGTQSGRWTMLRGLLCHPIFPSAFPCMVFMVLFVNWYWKLDLQVRPNNCGWLIKYLWLREYHDSVNFFYFFLYYYFF